MHMLMYIPPPVLLSRFPRDILLPMGQMEMEKESIAVLQRVLFASVRALLMTFFLSFFSVAK